MVGVPLAGQPSRPVDVTEHQVPPRVSARSLIAGFDMRLFYLALLFLVFSAGCSQTTHPNTPDSALLRLGHGEVGTGETIASPPPTSTIPSYYQEVGGFRKQYCGLRAGSANTGN